jgi:hypothetical protein
MPQTLGISSDNIQSRIEFIINQQAQFSADIGQLKEVQKQQAENINKLTGAVQSIITEMREGFNNLIVANEVTRDLAQQAAKVAIQAGPRITKLEEKAS